MGYSDRDKLITNHISRPRQATMIQKKNTKFSGRKMQKAKQVANFVVDDAVSM